ncbi:MAG: accessory gene regulator B family protein, partial [Desulfamplus sp.]|nr:accessory gene regulator B family protein [Desulfamplus sp.]
MIHFYSFLSCIFKGTGIFSLVIKLIPLIRGYPSDLKIYNYQTSIFIGLQNINIIKGDPVQSTNKPMSNHDTQSCPDCAAGSGNGKAT